MKELSEESKFNISIKTLVGIGVGLSMLIGMYFTLQADITEAKELPIPEVSKMEFQMKDELVRETIMNTQADVEEIKEDIDGMDEKLDELQEMIYELK
jgi:ribosomal protein S13